jgi:hypothetical protein
MFRWGKTEAETVRGAPKPAHLTGLWNFGAGDRIRTGDIDLGKVALYQLSYSRAGKYPFSTRNIWHVKCYYKMMKILQLYYCWKYISLC